FAEVTALRDADAPRWRIALRARDRGRLVGSRLDDLAVTQLRAWPALLGDLAPPVLLAGDAGAGAISARIHAGARRGRDQLGRRGPRVGQDHGRARGPRDRCEPLVLAAWLDHDRR